MPLDLDKLEQSIRRDKVWVPATMQGGVLRFAEQATIENRGAYRGTPILLSRKKPSDFEEQDIGTYKLNENKRTVQLDGKDWGSGKALELVGNDELVPAKATERVYIRKMGAWIPRYKVDSDQRHFLKSLKRAQNLIAAKELGASYRSEQPAIGKTGQLQSRGTA